MPAPARRSPLGVIFLTVFLDLLGFGMVIPILPLYAKTLHASDVAVGALLATYSVMQLFFAPVWGRLSDRVGRRPVILVSVLGSCLSQLGYALAGSFTGLVMARALAGICGANISAAQAYIADSTDERSRAAGMGMLGAAFGLGFVFGPAAGGLLSRHSAQLPFFVASALAAVNFLLALAILVEPRRTGERTASQTLTWQALVRTLSRSRLMVLIGLFFVVTFGFAILEATFPLYLHRRFDFDGGRVAWVFAYVGVVMIVVQGALVRRLVAAFGERTMVVLGTLLMATGMVLLYVAHGMPALILAVGVVATGNGLNTPSLSSLISRSAGADQQGGVLGVTQSFGALARIGGPIVGGALLALGDAAPYLLAAGIIGSACLLAVTMVRQPGAASPSTEVIVSE
jgi:multidrug resistance protein